MDKSKEEKAAVDNLLKMTDYKLVTKFQKEISENLTAENFTESFAESFAALLGGRDNIPKAVIDEMENIKILESQNKKELSERIFMDQFLMTESVNIDDPYGDGDQSMLYGEAGTKLQMQWCSGYDYNPNTNPRLSDWCRSLYFARISDVNKSISKAKEGSASDLTQLLNRRESMLRFGGVLHIIAGAKQSPSSRHLELMKTLLNAGADPNIKDCAGYSALHHCFTIRGNSMTLKLAELLLEHGGDVNGQNRLGYTPLMEHCLLNANFEVVEFLISNGANPSIKGNNGVRCETLAIANPKLQSMLSKGKRAHAKKDKAKKKGSSSAAITACVYCGHLDNLKRCTGCLAVSYCTQECQKLHWKAHKSECKNNSKIVLVKPVKKIPGYECLIRNLKTQKLVETDSVFSEMKKPFKIKVQVFSKEVIFHATGSDNLNNPMLVYNKDRSYQTFILPSDDGFKEVCDAVCTKGYSGIKAYFCATLQKPGELAINVSTVFPETW